MVTLNRQLFVIFSGFLMIMAITWFITTAGLLSDNSSVFMQPDDVTLPFISNRGQVNHSDVAFHTNSFYGDTFITDRGEITYRLKTGGSGKSWVLKEQLIGAAPVSVRGISKSDAKIHFIGQIEQGSHDSLVAAYKTIGWREVYPKVDLTLKRNKNSIEKILTVLPGGNPALIKWHLSGALSLHLADNGELIVTTGNGSVRFSRPVAFQDINGVRTNVTVKYVLDNNNYGFSLEDYDPALPLIIDPLLASTYIGSSDFDADTDSIKILYDSTADEVVFSGATNGMDFPTTVGAYDTTHNSNGKKDIFVVRMSSDLSSIIAATFLGGSGSDVVRDMILSPSGNIVIGGDTSSPDYPVSAGVIKTTFSNLRDTFVTVLSADLSTLIASTLFGDTGTECVGSGGDYAAAITSDSNGNIYLAGNTTSRTLPIPVNAYQVSISQGSNNFPCGQDAFIVKMNSSLTSVLAATYYGTGGQDNLIESVVALELDDANNIYLAGWAPHSTLPVTVAGGNFAGGANETYIAQFNNTLTKLTASRYLGGTGQDVAQDFKIAAGNNLYIIGYTTSLDFPTTMGAWLKDAPLSVPTGSSMGTVISLDSNLGIIAASYLYRTLPQNLVIDPSTTGGEIALVGLSSADFPYLTNSYDPIDDNLLPSKLFVSRFNPALTSLFAATTLHGQCRINCAITADTNGNIFVMARAIAPNNGRNAIDLAGMSYDTSYNSGGSDVFISKLSVNLDGSGILQATPSTHDFGTVDVPVTQSTVYPAIEIVFTNNGTGWLSVAVASLAGSGSGQFSIDANTCSGNYIHLRPQIILPDLNRSCKMTLSFRPNTIQTAKWIAQLQVTSSDPTTPVTSIILMGNTQDTTGTVGNANTGGSGGGCILNQNAKFDPALFLLLVFSLIGVFKRRFNI